MVSNPNKVQIDTLFSNEQNKIKIDISEPLTPEKDKAKLHSILKKVSFQETPQTNKPSYSNEPRNVKVDSALKRLQDEREKLLHYDKPNVEPIVNENFKATKAILNKSSHNLTPVPGKPISKDKIPLESQSSLMYNYNTLLINKHYMVSKNFPFLKSPIIVSLKLKTDSYRIK